MSQDSDIQQEATPSTERPTYDTVIRPPRGWHLVDLKEVWRYRDLLYYMVHQQYSGRYRQSVFGFVWAFLQPIMNILVMTLIFGKVVGITFEKAPYAIGLFAGQLPWAFFQSSASSAVGSLVGRRSLLQKVYIPRVYLPLVAICSRFVELGIAFIVFAGLFVVMQFMPSWKLIFLPIACIHTILITMTIGLFFSGLNAKFRDVGFAVPYALQVCTYLTPVLYPTDYVMGFITENGFSSWLIYVYYLNPMVGNIDLYRTCIIGYQPNLAAIGISLLVTIMMLFPAMLLFKRAEAIVVDVA